MCIRDRYKISQLDEYNHSVITFIINGRRVSCPRFVQVNGELEPEDYSIRENDVIETRNYYTCLLYTSQLWDKRI